MSVSAKIWFAIKLYHPPLNRQASQIHLDWRMLSWKNPTQYFFLCLCLIHYSFLRFKRNIATGKTSQAITQRFPDQKLSSTIFPCCLSVPHQWHLHLSPRYDVLVHTNHTFSEGLWHPLSTDNKSNIWGNIQWVFFFSLVPPLKS